MHCSPTVFPGAHEPLLLSLGHPHGHPGPVGPTPIRQDTPRLSVLAQGFLILKPGQWDVPGGTPKAQHIRVTTTCKVCLWVMFTAGGAGEEKAEPVMLGANPRSL